MSYLDDYLSNMNWSPKEGQCGYRYSSPGLVTLHVTSAIQDDASAIEYISRIETWFPKTKVFLIEKRDAGQQNWRLIHRVEEANRVVHVLPDEPVHLQPEVKPVEEPKLQVIAVPPIGGYPGL